jgi:hypothetical protein
MQAEHNSSDRTTALRPMVQSGRGRLRVAHIPTQGVGIYAPPAGCVGGAAVGALEAVPYTVPAAIFEFGWTYWHHH